MGLGATIAKRLRKAAFKKPDVTVKTVLPRAVTTRGSTVKLTLNVSNPNRYALDVVGIDYTVRKVSDRTKIAEGTLTESFRIPPRDNVDANMDVSITYSGLGYAGRSIALRGGKVRCAVSGSITIRKVRTIVIPFEKEREFSIFDGQSRPVDSAVPKEKAKVIMATNATLTVTGADPARETSNRRGVQLCVTQAGERSFVRRRELSVEQKEGVKERR